MEPCPLSHRRELKGLAIEIAPRGTLGWLSACADKGIYAGRRLAESPQVRLESFRFAHVPPFPSKNQF